MVVSRIIPNMGRLVPILGMMPVSVAVGVVAEAGRFSKRNQQQVAAEMGNS